MNSACTLGWACMYGASIWVCFVRYIRKALLAHLPLTLMTLNRTPHKRYSRVDPMWMLCPCMGLRPALVAAVARALMKAGLVRGQ